MQASSKAKAKKAAKRPASEKSDEATTAKKRPAAQPETSESSDSDSSSVNEEPPKVNTEIALNAAVDSGVALPRRGFPPLPVLQESEKFRYDNIKFMQ